MVVWVSIYVFLCGPQSPGSLCVVNVYVSVWVVKCERGGVTGVGVFVRVTVSVFKWFIMSVLLITISV